MGDMIVLWQCLFGSEKGRLELLWERGLMTTEFLWEALLLVR